MITRSSLLRVPGIRLIFLTIFALLLTGCANLGYYAQSVQGQLSILAHRQPIEQLLNDPDTSAITRSRLQRVLQLRQYAGTHLQLAHHGSYQDFSKLDRNYAVWNVVATPEFSLTPVQWCFMVVGCLSYRGYFDENQARSFANQLQEQGHDVFVGGVAAYSTLGWFNDPVLSPMLSWSDSRLANVIFHELAHQRVYIPDDTEFNEAFASAVASLGTQHWMDEHASDSRKQAFDHQQQFDLLFTQLVLDVRDQLIKLYGSHAGKLMDENTMRDQKKEILTQMYQDYLALRQDWPNTAGYGAWFEQGVNNARIAIISTYHQLIPAFFQLYEVSNRHLPLFYKYTEELSVLPKHERHTCLTYLQGSSVSLEELKRHHCLMLDK